MMWHIHGHGKWNGWTVILQVINALDQKRDGHTRLDSLCTDTVEDRKFLDTPVHVQVNVVTMHECKTIIMALTACVQQIMVLPT